MAEAAGSWMSKQITSPPRCSRNASRRWRHSCSSSSPPASLLAVDAMAGEALAHHSLHALRVVLNLGPIRPQDPPGYVLRGGRAGCCLANQCPRSSMSIRGWRPWSDAGG